MAEILPIGFGWNYPLTWELGRSPYAQPLHRRRCRQLPTEQPITLQEAILHLRLDPDAENGPEAPFIEGMIAAATRMLEQYASVAVMKQRWQMSLNHFPAPTLALEIPLPPFLDLVSIDVNGHQEDIADYMVELDDRLPSRLYPLSHFWRVLPIPRTPGAIKIEWECGHERPEDVPPTVKQAIFMAMATWYENRESLQQFTLNPMIEVGWDAILGHYREPGFA
jgi:uncharacterized phiE125 gp8 family phage protein